jgi:cytochrome c-type biogenesis protein CcsB
MIHMRLLVSTLAVVAAVLPCPSARAQDVEFRDAVDLESFGQLAIQTNGRIKSVDSYTSAVMQQVTGGKRIEGQSATFTYLDMMLRPGEYVDQDAIYVHKKPVREKIADAMRIAFGASITPEISRRIESFTESGLISDRFLRLPEVELAIDAMRVDLIRTAKFAEEIDFARLAAHPMNLRGGLRLVPPSGASIDAPWLTPDEFAFASTTSTAATQGDSSSQIAGAWQDFCDGWVSRDATRVNDAAAALVQWIPSVNPVLYPRSHRTGWPWSLDRGESIAPWVASLGVLAGALTLSFGLTLSGRRRAAPIAGLIASLIAAMHIGALLLGRINWLELESFYFNNHHWFTLIWLVYMVSVIFLLMAVVYRWSASRVIGLSIFAIAFALHTGALMLRWYVADRWPNSNMYEAVTTAAWFGGCAALLMELLSRRSAMRNLFALGSAAASMTALMAAHYLPQYLNAGITNKMPVLDDVWLYIHTNVIIFSYCLIFMAAMVALVYLGHRVGLLARGMPGSHEFARVGGAGSLILQDAEGSSSRTTVGQVLDGATMILMELSFVLLWAGIIMGAMWADHSWGRPWGWDPKEVFALNTFIVFAVLVHVRLKVKDKGLWTSLLVVAGCVVMLFNWIFINFKIAGLHSYA